MKTLCTNHRKKGSLMIKFNILFTKHKNMLRLIIFFLVFALIAALFGFTGLAAGAAAMAKIVFYIFLVLFIFSVIGWIFRGFK